MVYQGFNKHAYLPKSELTLDLAQKPPWWKLFSVNSESIFAISLKADSSSMVFPHWFYKIAPSKILESFMRNFFAISLLTKLQAFNL